MRKDSLDILNLTGYIEGMRGSRKQRVSYLTRLCKWIDEQRVAVMVKRQKHKDKKLPPTS